MLAHPYVRVWAVCCLEQLKLPPPQSARPLAAAAADLGHLGAIAAAAAIRSGTDALLSVPVVDGGVHLPALGRFETGQQPAEPGGDPALATVEISGGTVRGADRRRPVDFAHPGLLTGRPRPGPETGEPGPYRWQPVRRLTAPGISVALEDTDPYRDCHQFQAAGPAV